MQIEELQNVEMYCLFAPDGSWQGMTLAPDFPTCVATMRMLHKAGLCQSFHELCKIEGIENFAIKSYYDSEWR
jgi:hypothetical protein